MYHCFFSQDVDSTCQAEFESTSLEFIAGPQDGSAPTETAGERRARRSGTKRRTRTLCPKLTVLSLTHGGTELECQLESSKKTVTFKCNTQNMLPTNIANNLMSGNLLQSEHTELFIELIEDIARQLKENPDRLPVVAFNQLDSPVASRKPRDRERDPSLEPQARRDETVTISKLVDPGERDRVCVSGPSSPMHVLTHHPLAGPPSPSLRQVSRFLVSSVSEDKSSGLQSPPPELYQSPPEESKPPSTSVFKAFTSAISSKVGGALEMASKMLGDAKDSLEFKMSDSEKIKTSSDMEECTVQYKSGETSKTEVVSKDLVTVETQSISGSALLDSSTPQLEKPTKRIDLNDVKTIDPEGIKELSKEVNVDIDNCEVKQLHMEETSDQAIVEKSGTKHGEEPETRTEGKNADDQTGLNVVQAVGGGTTPVQESTPENTIIPGSGEQETLIEQSHHKLSQQNSLDKATADASANGPQTIADLQHKLIKLTSQPSELLLTTTGTPPSHPATPHVQQSYETYMQTLQQKLASISMPGGQTLGPLSPQSTLHAGVASATVLPALEVITQPVLHTVDPGGVEGAAQTALHAAAILSAAGVIATDMPIALVQPVAVIASQPNIIQHSAGVSRADSTGTNSSGVMSPSQNMTQEDASKQLKLRPAAIDLQDLEQQLSQIKVGENLEVETQATSEQPVKQALVQPEVPELTAEHSTSAYNNNSKTVQDDIIQSESTPDTPVRKVSRFQVSTVAEHNAEDKDSSEKNSSGNESGTGIIKRGRFSVVTHTEDMSAPSTLDKFHQTEIRTSIFPSSAVALNTTSALANYATEAVSFAPNFMPSALLSAAEHTSTQLLHMGFLATANGSKLQGTSTTKAQPHPTVPKPATSGSTNRTFFLQPPPANRKRNTSNERIQLDSNEQEHSSILPPQNNNVFQHHVKDDKPNLQKHTSPIFDSGSNILSQQQLPSSSNLRTRKFSQPPSFPSHPPQARMRKLSQPSMPYSPMVPPQYPHPLYQHFTSAPFDPTCPSAWMPNNPSFAIDPTNTGNFMNVYPNMNSPFAYPQFIASQHVPIPAQAFPQPQAEMPQFLIQNTFTLPSINVQPPQTYAPHKPNQTNNPSINPTVPPQQYLQYAPSQNANYPSQSSNPYQLQMPFFSPPPNSMFLPIYQPVPINKSNANEAQYNNPPSTHKGNLHITNKPKQFPEPHSTARDNPSAHFNSYWSSRNQGLSLAQERINVKSPYELPDNKSSNRALPFLRRQNNHVVNVKHADNMGSQGTLGSIEEMGRYPHQVTPRKRKQGLGLQETYVHSLPDLARNANAPVQRLANQHLPVFSRCASDNELAATKNVQQRKISGPNLKNYHFPQRRHISSKPESTMKHFSSVGDLSRSTRSFRGSNISYKPLEHNRVRSGNNAMSHEPRQLLRAKLKPTRSTGNLSFRDGRKHHSRYGSNSSFRPMASPEHVYHTVHAGMMHYSDWGHDGESTDQELEFYDTRCSSSEEEEDMFYSHVIPPGGRSGNYETASSAFCCGSEADISASRESDSDEELALLEASNEDFKVLLKRQRQEMEAMQRRHKEEVEVFQQQFQGGSVSAIFPPAVFYQAVSPLCAVGAGVQRVPGGSLEDYLVFSTAPQSPTNGEQQPGSNNSSPPRPRSHSSDEMARIAVANNLSRRQMAAVVNAPVSVQYYPAETQWVPVPGPQYPPGFRRVPSSSGSLLQLAPGPPTVTPTGYYFQPAVTPLLQAGLRFVYGTAGSAPTVVGSSGPSSPTQSSQDPHK
ncbi:unnamed protein product [Timema podura]|uniref:Serine/threonine-protein kinase WNK CCTL2 domain-containing protein n=1 Tax=Timema podura TaxID=61482 RepID=A0ABN7NF74_TIMPD|nr:unnamed protein product [Timema podura]